MPLSTELKCFTLCRGKLVFPLLYLFQVKTLTEEATNRKALIESLKRRLNVATTEKSQYEASCTKLKEDLEKKVGCVFLSVEMCICKYVLRSTSPKVILPPFFTLNNHF